MKEGISADYVLMDNLIYPTPLIQSIVEIGLDVIGMVKNTNQRYLVDNQRLSLKELYSFAKPLQGKHGILRSSRTMMANGIKVKIVFVQNIFMV